MKERNFLMAGGGTGGHVIPALAVAHELQARGHDVCFVGTERGLEAKLVPAAGFELQKIQIGGLNRVGLRQTFATLAGCRLPLSAATAAFARHPPSSAWADTSPDRPCWPLFSAAIPVVVMEPNAVPGFTNRSICALGLARAGHLSGDRALFPERPDRSHRASRARRVLSHPA